MARIFNIYFTYNHTSYSAMVTVRTTPFFTEYALANLDPAILELLPGNKIVSTGCGPLRFQYATAQYPASLMNAITSAVSEHLHLSKV
jgi:hypothetical protein